MWLVHSDGFSSATLVKDRRGVIMRLPSDDVSFGTDIRDERCKIQIGPSGMVKEVDAGDVEKVRMMRELNSLLYQVPVEQ